MFLLSFLISVIGISGQPIFEDDYFRYLWDAYVFHHYGTPYGLAPESFFSDGNIPALFQEILGYINHPSLPTIYGPTLQYSFLFAHMIAPGQVWVLQSLYGLANLLIIAIGLRLVPPPYVLVYAFSPLIFKETLLTAHTDGFAVAFLFAACWAKHKSYYYLTGSLLALSIGAKIFAFLLLPFLMLRHPIKVICGLIPTLFLLYFPFVQGGASDFMGLSHMANDWEFNSAVWGIAKTFFSIDHTRLLIASLLVAVLACYAWHFYQQQRLKPTLIPRGDIIIGCFLIVSPVINPWYLLWILPFAMIRPSVTAWFAGFIVFLAYFVPIYFPSLNLTGNYDQPLFLRWLEFGLLALVFLGEYWWRYTQTERTAIVKTAL